MYAEDEQTYKVAINHEHQYPIWLARRKNPSGWLDVGKEGKKAACLDYIKEIWIDMRPNSVHQRLARANHPIQIVNNDE